jgi:RHS repeat-associated protein
VFDGFGRTLEVISGFRVGATDTSVSRVKTEYAPCACSSIGKVRRVSMPYAANGSPTHWTTYDYDEIGRTVKVTPPGNAGFTSYQYGGTTVRTVDPKGKWKKFENDALGNLITVWEPHPIGPGADYVTTYTYTLLGKLSLVTMPRPGKGVGSPPTVTQTRTFTYNSNGELTSILHPENGTVSYLYNADGSLQRKTDAKNQRVEWAYDPQGRPVTVRRFLANGVEDPCARVTYLYGGQNVDPSFNGSNLAGRLAAVTTGCQHPQGEEEYARGGKVDELYSYNSAGAVLTKRVRIVRGNSTVTKDIGYTFDGEGKLATMQYPDEPRPFVMSYDAMARPSGMTQEYQQPGVEDWFNRNWVSGVSYGVAGQLLGMSWFGGGSSMFGETRTYNERLQLTRQQATGMDLEYRFVDPDDPDPLKKLNDGRIIARINRLNTANPETVKYKYDELNRLIEAEQTTGPAAPSGQAPGSNWWGMTWDYDGFGNRWSQDQKPGRQWIPSSVTFDLGTNRVNSLQYGHDANGNMTAMPGASAMTYDVDNRLTQVQRNGSHEQYRYLGDNKRYWKRANQGGVNTEEYYLYGVGGQRIATYPASYNVETSVLTVNAGYKKLDVYFGGRVIWQNGRAVVQDRLGSVMARGNGSGGVESHDYYPYGEERVATVGDRNKFGTYHRDQTGLDYGDQRYYNSAIGRFLTSDPYEASGGAAEPGSWGRGGYVHGDPANLFDPRGLQAEGPPHDPYRILTGLIEGRLRQDYWNEVNSKFDSDDNRTALERSIAQTTTDFRLRSAQAVRHMNQHCLDQLQTTMVPGKNTSIFDGLIQSIQSVTFFDSNNEVQLGATMSELIAGSPTSGIPNFDTQSFGQYITHSPEKRLVTAAAAYGGAFGHGIAILPGSLKDRGPGNPTALYGTLIHELLHPTISGGHRAIAGALGLTFTPMPPGLGSAVIGNDLIASAEIDNWISQCLK